MYIQCTCLLGVCVCVRPLPEVRGRGLPIDLHVTKGGRTVVVLSYHKVGGGVTSPRSLEPSGPSATQRRLRLGGYRTPLA